jgi:hypothetical protein
MTGIVITDEMKPCPFCGWINVEETHEGIFCHQCHAQVISAGVQSDKDLWNRRVPHPQEGGKEAGEPVGYGVWINGKLSGCAKSHSGSFPVYGSPIPARDTARAEGVADTQALIDQLRRLVDNQTGGDALVLVQRQLFNRVVGRLAAFTAPVRAADNDLVREACILLERACAYAGDAIPASILRQSQDLHQRLSALSLSPGTGEKDRIAELEAERNKLQKLINDLDPQEAWDDTLLRDIHLRLQIHGEKYPERMVSVLHRNVVFYKTAEALRAALTDNKEG